MNDILFSIITPTFNRAHMLPTAIKSVLSQTYSNWELIIIDDGSTDNTSKVVKGYTDDRIKYIYQENAERSAARNKGISLASGKYICFLDSDDFYLPHHLDSFYKRIKEMMEPIAFFYSKLFIEENEILSFPEEDICRFDTLVEFVSLNLICPQQACLHKEIFLKHQFNTELTVGEDLNLWMRVVMDYPLIEIQDRTLALCIHEDRTVNVRKRNIYKKHLYSFNLAIKDKRIKNSISNKVRKAFYGESYLGMGKYYALRKEKWKAIVMLTLSIICRPDFQVKFKINIIYCLLFKYQEAYKLAS